MVRQPVRLALLLGALTALAVSPARANNCCAPCSTPCGTTTRTIQVTECVPEVYTVKRTVYKVECKKEVVDGFRCETVQVKKQREVCCVKRVPVEEWQVRKVCRKVTEYENREVCKKVWRNVEETVMKKRCVALGHWECRESCRTPLFGGHGHGNSCDPCATSCCTVRTHKVWVYCPQYECCPVKVCKKVCVEEKQICKVPVCRTVWTEEKVKVCSYKCVEEKRMVDYIECQTVKVPCKIERTVRVCVPHVEEVKCTRYVTRCVTREVACPAPACCNDCCRPSLGDRIHDCLSRLRSNGCCQRESCCH